MAEQTNAIVPDERAEIVADLMSDPAREAMDFASWYLAVDNDCLAALERAKAQYEKIVAYYTNRRKALAFRFGQEFRVQVEADLAEQRKKDKRKKSVTYPTGTAGFRKAPMMVLIKDKKALMDWAGVNLPEAVPMEPRLHVTPLKEHFKKTGEEPPGCEIVGERESFFPAVPRLELRHGTPDGTSDGDERLSDEPDGPETVD